MIFDDIIKISQERKIEMRTAASIMAIGRVAVAELSKEIAEMVISTHPHLSKEGKGNILSEETLEVLRKLSYLST